MILQVLLLIISLFIIYYGAEFTLQAAGKIGLAFGLSPLLIGVVIVGFGTSLPELFVSQFASYRGDQDLALGNILGSNIANLFLILGLASLILPLKLNQQLIQGQLVLHFFVTVLFAGILISGSFTWWGALGLLLFISLYLYLSFSKRDLAQRVIEEVGIRPKLHFKSVLLLILGFIGLFGGSELLVFSAGNLALLLGVSSFVIAATLIAFGTSLPELIMVIIIARKKMSSDLIIGNIIGSNAFNIGFVFLSLYIYQLTFSASYLLEVSALICASCLLLLFALSRVKFLTLSRVVGVFFLMVYIGICAFWALSS